MILVHYFRFILFFEMKEEVTLIFILHLNLLISIQIILRFYLTRHQFLLKIRIFILIMIKYLDNNHIFQEYYFKTCIYTKMVKEHFS